MGKHHKKSNKHKKHSKKQESNSSSEDEWVEAELVEKQKKNSSRKRYQSSSESSAEEIIKKRKSRRDRSESSVNSRSSSSSYERKKRISKKKSKRRHNRSNESSEEDAYRKTPNQTMDRSRSPGSSETLDKKEQNTDKREDWMDLSTSFSSFSNENRRKQKELEKKQQKEAEQYNPSKCPRELNPYWKDGGDGLPKFQKPKNYDSDDDSYRYSKRKASSIKPHQSGWRKNKVDQPESSSTKFNSSKSREDDQKGHIQKDEKPVVAVEETDKTMTEKELNLLAGKLVKAEILGNEKLVKELKEKLENGRKALAEAKVQDEEIILTQTDRQGHSKPLTLQTEYEEKTSKKKQRKKALDTHKDKQRVRYFPDDDKYSLKQMFENEKFNTGNDQDSEFMKIASNIRKNDDLDDLFADNVRRKKSDSKIEEASRSKAISQHQKMSDSLDNCPRCIQSSAMQKHLIVSMGEYVYLSMPSYEPLMEGHCLIVPVRHVSSVTQLDENEWEEMRDFRKALVRMFGLKKQEPIFYEIATGFYKYPHMVLECVPLPIEEADMAPIYFKKAIDESETEWAQNKKLVSLKDRDVRRAIPKGLPYFSVSFGMNEGFAHVIEDERLFPRNFAQEIIGGMLDLHHSKWRKPIMQSFDVQSKRVLQFSDEWKEFDCTVKQ